MAQYLMSVLGDAANSATAEEMAAINAVNEQLQTDGNHLVDEIDDFPPRLWSIPAEETVGGSR
jgi:hypothetical protein